MAIPKNKFREAVKTAKLHAWYRKRLLKVAKAVGQIVNEYNAETDPIIAVAETQGRLFAYSETLRGWAESVAEIMLKRAADADYDVWKDVGKTLSRATMQILKSQDRGAVYERLKQEQVTLITSIPLDAAQTVVEWSREAMIAGERWEGIAERIHHIALTTESRARCIARTETARARSNFTQARAEAIGSTHYIWHTVGDGAVREDHRLLDGTIQRWDDPPIADRKSGTRSHAGCLWNCRCWASPLFPDRTDL